MSEVIRHVVASISAASQAHAEGARLRVAGAGAPILERLAIAMAAAQHDPAPRADSRTGIIVAGDHGVGDPGISLGEHHPTVTALAAIDAGTAALAQIARSAKLPLVLVDAGMREPSYAPASIVKLGRGPTHDLTREPAMTVIDATLGLEAGIALVVALEAPDVLVLGAIGVGSEVCADAILDAPTSMSGLDLLATYGGPETAVLTGVILAAASLNVVVVLDNYATGAAALVAERFAPASRGYLIASHAGTFGHPKILRRLDLLPVFEVGLGHGEGTGAAMIVPLLDQVASLVVRS